ncbi:MAG: rod shape-determining protein MreD [Ruminococcus sp.]|nr:rod shape-determining protein MreD [Ruminococcus sp.]
MEKRNKTIRFASYGLEILVFFILQGVPNLIPEIYGGKPILLIPIAITISCSESEVTAMFFGLACGAMLDFGNGVHIGFYTFALTILCFFIGYSFENFFNRNLLLVLVISIVAIPLLVSGEFLFGYIINGYGNAGYYYVHHCLSIMAYTFLTTPVFYLINFVLSRSFS